MFYKIFYLFLFFLPLQGKAPAPQENLKLAALYNSLDPTSFSQLFAFYDLYPDTEQGGLALEKVRSLFHLQTEAKRISLPTLDMQAILSLVNRQPHEIKEPLTVEQLTLIDHLAGHLYNRKLKGYYCRTPEEILALAPEELDLARALLLYQFDKESFLEIRRYEAMIDMMTLQVMARLSPHATALEKIDAINRLIFHEMRFRFPPHSLHINDIDLYTFLPSVLDDRLGVCLGVSILYLSIAQRLNLPLEIITPPGHIYVRYHEGNTLVNIETTARGIHIPTETYLGINTHALQTRTIKEVVGFAFMNQASVLSERKQYEETVALYEKAQLFLPDDPLLKMLLGMHYILVDRTKEGKKLFKEIKGKPFPDAIYPENLPEDYLNGYVTQEALAILFMHVDETRESILKKQHALQKALKTCPKFRGGLLQLAITYLQLGRSKEGLEILQKYHALDPHDPTVNYYLSSLSATRLQYKKAWFFLTQTKTLLSTKNHFPKALRDLEYELRHSYPESLHSSTI